MPLRIIPDLGQVPENAAKPFAWLLRWATKQTCDVLHENEFWSKVASKSKQFDVKAASCALANAGASAGRTDILAGESPNNDVGNNSVCFKLGGGEFSDVGINWNLGPVLSKDSLPEGLNLAERDSLETARALKAKVEAADASEQRQNIELV